MLLGAEVLEGPALFFLYESVQRADHVDLLELVEGAAQETQLDRGVMKGPFLGRTRGGIGELDDGVDELFLSVEEFERTVDAVAQLGTVLAKGVLSR